MLDRPPFAGASAARLHFIHHQQNSVPIADAPQLLHELRRRDHISALALDRLHKDRRDFFRWKRGLEQLLFDKTRTINSILPCVYAFRTAVQVGIGHMAYAWNQRGKTPPLLRLGSSERERAHGAAVESSIESDDPLALGVIPGEFERSLYRFCA